MRKLSKILNPTLVAALLTMQLAPGFLFPEPAQAVLADGAPAIDAVGHVYRNPESPNVLQPNFLNTAINETVSFGLYNPIGLALDSAGHRLFISDASNNRVVVHNLDSNNAIVDLEADAVLGQADLFSGAPNRGGSASASSMNYPSGVLWDSANSRLFVSDMNNNRTLVFDLSSGLTNGMAASYVLGQANFTSNSVNRGGSAAANTLNFPYGMAWDSSGSRLFLAELFNNRVLSFDLSSGITNGMSASNVLGQADFTSNSADRGGSAGANTLDGPIYLAWDSSNSRLMVSDYNNHRILAYDLATIADGEPAVNVLGQANFTSTSADRGGSAGANTLDKPFDIAWDSVGSRLFVSDWNNHRVLAYDLATIADGEPAVNVLGQADFTSTSANRGGSAAANTMYNPYAMAWDSANSRLFVSESGNSRAMAFDLSTFTDGESAVNVLGQASSISTSYPPTVSGESFTRTAINGGPFSFGLYFPIDMAVDATGRHLFVVDYGNNRVLVYDTDAYGRPSDPVADHVLGQADFISGSANRGGSAAANTLSAPSGVVWDAAGSRLFVADYSNSRVVVYDLSTITDGEAAANVLGQADFTTGTANRGGSVAANTLYRPSGMSWDSANSRLFVADNYNNRVLAYDLATVADGEPAVNVLGQANFTSNSVNRGGSAAANTLNKPTQLNWSSADSRLFVTDQNNNRVLAYDLATVADGEAAANVLGQADFTSVSANRGGSAGANTLNAPSRLAWDSSNSRLFVSDGSNHRVLAYDLATIADGEPAVNVLGQADFTSNSANRGGNAAANTLNSPRGLAYNSTKESLFVADLSNNRVFTFDVATAAGTLVATRDNSVTLSRLKAGESATFSLSFNLSHTLSSTLTVTFPAGFTVTAAATTASSSSCLSDFSYTSNTLTANKTLCGGPITLGGATVTLPSTPGSYTITWVNDDPGSATVVIVGNDQISITATVAPTVSFLAVAQPAASTCANTVDLTGADYTLALGTLNVATITESESLNADSDTVERICTQGSTNATSGMAVTVKNANGSSGLVSSSVPADTIPSSASGQLAAGTPGYGVCVRGSSLASDSGLTPTGADPTATGSFSTYECESASGNIVALTGAAQGLWSASGPTQDATAAIWVRVAISAVQPAHNDYADSLTFVATATY